MMALDLAFMITAFATIIVIIDPFAIGPMFLALTPGMTPRQRRLIAWRSVIIAGLILLVFAAFGEAVLGFIGISMPAFRVAGGVLLFLTALDMLFDRRTKRREGHAEADDDHDDPSVFPLAIPLIAGPGAIASVILLTGEKPGLEGLVTVVAITFAVLLIMGITMQASGYLENALGKVGINVITRLLGMLLAALSVQFVLDGLSAFGFGPGPG
ncbi:NAAT family transporter [Sulfitobacter sp. M220]|jgi:multiple antibiotic resistance protein|nr:NAAT family transporter [Sulfitobacter sp. M22]MCF7777214.1 NAAT family transporter [Sulfitobacter sp. M220]